MISCRSKRARPNSSAGNTRQPGGSVRAIFRAQSEPHAITDEAQERRQRGCHDESRHAFQSRGKFLRARAKAILERIYE